jgi:hypothetical protein
MKPFLATLAAVLLAAVVPLSASADEAAQMYQPGTVLEIDLGLSEAAEKALEEEPDEDVDATFTARLTDGTPGGSTTILTSDHPVEVHLKGHVGGSFRPLTGKAALKLKFKKTERFLGLRKMTLNNMVEDPSMLHETLTYSLFRAAGVPASRTGFAYLRVNGEDFGLYLDLENVDETFLAGVYGAGNTLHLYEGEYGADADADGVAAVDAVVPEGAPRFEMDEGEGPPADLETLAEAVAAGSPSFSVRLAGLADLDEMTRMWAVEKYISHWDGYSGEEASNKPNNYYLHSDLGGLFQMLPWGTDNTWQTERRIGFDGPGGLLFNGCLGDPGCERLYVAALKGVQGAVGAVDPEGLAGATATLLRPWQELEAAESTREEYSLAAIDAAVASVHQYIAARPGELAAWLAAHEPPSAGGRQPTVLPSGSPIPSRLLRLAGVVKRPHAVRLLLRAFGEGTLSERGVLRTREGDRTACADEVRVGAPGAAGLTCELSRAVLRRLRKHGLELHFLIRLRGASGEVARLTTVVRLRRD